jgi:hypothetical protein
MRNYLRKDIKLFIVIVILLMINSSYGYKNVEELVLIEDGKSKSNIILGKEPSQVEKFSANELQKYLKEITGVTLPIKEEITTQSKASIIVGKNNYTKSIDLSEEKLGSDGFVIKRDGSNLILVGREERGTLYSVYAFLEHLGCRFFAPGFAHYNGNHELIPKKKTISVGNLNIVEKPGFEVRMEHALQIGRGRVGEPKNLSTIMDWMAKNRLNVLQTSLTFATEEEYEGSRNELRKRGLLYASGSHDDWRQCLPIEKYGDEHPEWFARTTEGIFIGDPASGVREGSKGAPCASSEEAVELLSERYIDMVKEKSIMDIVIPFMPDGSWFCMCDDCKKNFGKRDMVSEKEATLRKRLYTRTNPGEIGALKQYLTIITPIVEKMTKQFPRKKIIPVLYHWTLDFPPKNFDLKPFKKGNVMIWWCNWPRDKRHPLDVTEDINPRLNASYQGMQAWEELGIPVLVSGHWIKYHARSWPDINSHLIADDYQKLNKVIKANGVSLFDAVPDNWYALELNHYVHSRCAWNPEFSIDSLLKDYYHARYKKAWEPMRDYFEYLDEAMNYRSIPGRCPSNPLSSLPKLIDNLDKCKVSINRALELAVDQKVISLIRKNKASLEYVIYDAEAMYHEKLFEEEGRVEDLEKAIQAEKSIMDIVDNYEGIILYDHGSFKNHHTSIPPRLSRNIQVVESLTNPDEHNLALAGNGGMILSAPEGGAERWSGKEAIIDGVKGDGLFKEYGITGKRIFHYLVKNHPSKKLNIIIRLKFPAIIDKIRVWQIDGRMAGKVTISTGVGVGGYEEIGSYELIADPVDGQLIKFPSREAMRVKLEFEDLQNPNMLGIVEVGVYKASKKL